MKGNPRVQPFSEREWAHLKEHLRLPPRQAEIARHILCGQSDKQIAREMGISLGTVRTHLSRLLGRFGLGDRVELLLYLLACLRQQCYPLDETPEPGQNDRAWQPSRPASPEPPAKGGQILTGQGG